ncbi:MAG TPA: hypothetical protein VI759_04745 [Dehalococcoidia bacterium]|nr:hypothetical protein [Dehalococcoidia bacterium]
MHLPKPAVYITAAVLLAAASLLAACGNGGTSPGPGSTATEPVATEPAAASPSPTAPTSSTAVPVPTSGGPDTPVSSTPGVVGTIIVDPIRPKPSAPPGTHLVLAPIDGADIRVLESFPAQYVLHVLAGLPNGCAKPAGYEVAQDGKTVHVKVFNSMPDGNPVCTAIYGTYELSIGIGSNFTSGTKYTVDVNGKTLTFVAQ